MASQGVTTAARDAFAAHRWRDAFQLLLQADRDAQLEPRDLETLANAAYLLGKDDECVEAWSRAHEAFYEGGDFPGATRCAFWIAFRYINAGEMALAGGWLARAQRIIDDAQLDCAECGYLLLPPAIQGCDTDPSASLATFRLATTIAERFGDRDLAAIARHGQARALIRLGEGARGMMLLDEVLVSVIRRELSAIVTGDVYCGAIEACWETFDVRRARAWTGALTRWCDAQPDLVPYRGQCLVYRSASLQAEGRWLDAMEEAAAACQWLTKPRPHPAAGAAFYQRAELHRLHGEFDAAEQAYERAGQFGHDPQPGLALLRVAQGRRGIAAASVRRLLHEPVSGFSRAKLLPAAVEVFLEAGDLAAAHKAEQELSAIAATFGSPYLSAASEYATGTVLFAEGRIDVALTALRKAQAGWRNLQTPYEAARTRLLIGLCCGKLADAEGASLELGAARRTFEELGAAPDVARVDLLQGGKAAHLEGLSERELEVLRLVATGRTNRSIADELVISEKTVGRHVSNIFAKIGVSSRSAATAYAYDRGLV